MGLERCRTSVGSFPVWILTVMVYCLRHTTDCLPAAPPQPAAGSPECGQVHVDQLAGEAGELVVDAGGEVAARLGGGLVLGLFLPLVRMDQLTGGVPNREPCHPVSAPQRL